MIGISIVTALAASCLLACLLVYRAQYKRNHPPLKFKAVWYTGQIKPSVTRSFTFSTFNKARRGAVLSAFASGAEDHCYVEVLDRGRCIALHVCYDVNTPTPVFKLVSSERGVESYINHQTPTR